MHAEFISPDDSRWKRYLESNWHDFYHLPDYVSACAKHEGGVPMAFFAQYQGASFLAPLILRPLPESLNAFPDWCDCVSPYGYSTPLLAPTQEQLPTFIEAFVDLAKERNVVAAFFRLHPFSELNKDDLCRFGQLVHHGQTIYLDLSITQDEFWKQVRRNHKQNYQRLVQDGFEVSVDDWAHLGEFAALYRETMQRVGAVSCLYSEQYFIDLQSILGPAMHLCCVRARTGSVVAGGVFVEMGGVVHYHLSATATDCLRLGPNKLIIPVMRAWSQGRMNRVLHLGGGVGGAYDSLFHFKAGFSGARADFYSYRVIVDQIKYESLSGIVATQAEGVPSIPTNFFPAYRRAVSHAPHLPPVAVDTMVAHDPGDGRLTPTALISELQ